MVPAVRDVVSRYPGGLGRRGSRRRGLDGAASSCSPPSSPTSGGSSTHSRPALRSAAAEPARTRTSPVARLLARGLLAAGRRRHRRAAPPGRARPARRPSAGCSRPSTPPELAHRRPRHRPRRRHRGRCGARRALRQVEQLLAVWGPNPPPVLRSGGLGVRDLRRVAREMDADEPTAALLVEVAVAADLVAESDGVGPGVGAHHRLRRLGREPSRAAVGRARPDLARPATAARPRRAPRRRRNGRSPRCPTESGGRLAPRDRRRVLAGLAELADGTAVGTPTALADLLAWRAPRRGGRLRDEVVRWTLAEATVLGRRRAGRAVEPGPGAARRSRPGCQRRCARRCRARRPRPAAGRPDRRRPRSARAGARPPSSTWWPTWSRPAAPPSTGSPKPRVRRALDAGRTAAELHELFATRSRDPGAAGAELPGRRRGPPARAAARRRGDVVPALATTRC